MSKHQASTVFNELRLIMKAHAADLEATSDGADQFTLESRDSDAKGKRRWFGSVQTKKNYVSYHLMPVYENPELLQGASPELRARMQGKSCFNFTAVDEGLFAQLAVLTERGRRDFG